MRRRHHPYRTLLGCISLLDGCERDTLELVARHADVVDLREGVVLTAPGAGRGGLLVVLSGAVRAHERLLQPGDCYVAASTARTTLVTASRCRLLVIARGLLMTLLDRDSELAARIAMRLPLPARAPVVTPHALT